MVIIGLAILFALGVVSACAGIKAIQLPNRRGYVLVVCLIMFGGILGMVTGGMLLCEAFPLEEVVR
jgi:hypothetical protein